MQRSRPATPTPPPLAVSLRLGHIAALTVHRTVIHYRDAASLPRGGEESGKWRFGWVWQIAVYRCDKPSPAGKGDIRHKASSGLSSYAVRFGWMMRSPFQGLGVCKKALFRCKRILIPQNKIHDTPVARVLMATSSSTTFGGPPSPLEKAIRDSSTNQNLKE